VLDDILPIRNSYKDEIIKKHCVFSMVTNPNLTARLVVYWPLSFVYFPLSRLLGHWKTFRSYLVFKYQNMQYCEDR